MSGLGSETEVVEFMFGVSNQMVDGRSFLVAALQGAFDGVWVDVEQAVSVTGSFAGYSGGSVPIFRGKATVTPNSKTLIQFRIKSALETEDVPFSHRVIATQCPYSLGGTGCGVALASFQHTRAAVAGSTPNVVRLDASSTHAVVGSVLKLTSGVYAGQARVVTAVAGVAVTLDSPFPGAPAVGVTCVITRACDKTRDMCITVFSNIINFGGFPFAPVE
jgi:hypothetical protein